MTALRIIAAANICSLCLHQQLPKGAANAARRATRWQRDALFKYVILPNVWVTVLITAIKDFYCEEDEAAKSNSMCVSRNTDKTHRPAVTLLLLFSCESIRRLDWRRDFIFFTHCCFCCRWPQFHGGHLLIKGAAQNWQVGVSFHCDRGNSIRPHLECEKLRFINGSWD